MLRDLRLGNVHLSEAEDDLYVFVRSGEMTLKTAERINLRFVRIVSDRMKGGAA